MYSPPLTRARARKLRELATQQTQRDGKTGKHRHSAPEMQSKDGSSGRVSSERSESSGGGGGDAAVSKKKPLSPSAVQQPSKRVKELQLTEEEAALKGAPEGAVYEVTVLNSEEIEPSKDPEAEMRHALEVVGSDVNADNWAEQHAAVDSIRRMAIHHGAVLVNHIGDAVRIVLNTITSLRSSMVRNALLAVKDLFQHVDEAMGLFTEEIVAAVLRKTSGDKKFICEAAVSTLSVVTEKGAFQPMLSSLSTGVQSKNADIAAHALKGIDELVTRFFKKGQLRQNVLEGADEADGSAPNVKLLLDALVAGLSAKSPAGKNAARATLRKIRQSLTAEVFEQHVRQLLSESAAEEVIREAARPAMHGSSKSTGAISRGTSIRERILAAQREQAAQLPHAASAGEITVEFKTKDDSVVMSGTV